MMDAADADDAAGDPLPALSFRTMQVDDLEAVRSLHEESPRRAGQHWVPTRARRSRWVKPHARTHRWFPVRYSTGFYDAAVRGKMARPPRGAF